MHAPSTTLPAALSEHSRSGRLRTVLERVGATIAAYLAAYRNAHAAAELYQNLSRLSDAELARRGLTRADIHRWVFEELDRPTASGKATADRTRN